MPPYREHRQLGLLWSALLVSPAAWAVSHGLLLVLVDEACAGIPSSVLVLTGIAFAAIALSGMLFARTAQRRVSGDDARAERGRFMASLAFWFAPLFALVVALSTSAVFFLSPCPN